MKTKEEMIAWNMNYCQHYSRGEDADMVCKAGMNLKEIKHVPAGSKGIKWGPCIEGHTLPDPTKHCPHWVRRTREESEKRAEQIESFELRMVKVMRLVDSWRTWSNENHEEKNEVVVCPVCN